MGLALILTIPLLRYMQLQAEKRWIRVALAGVMLLTLFAILGTQSRGALLGVVAMGAFLIGSRRVACHWRSRRQSWYPFY